MLYIINNHIFLDYLIYLLFIYISFIYVFFFHLNFGNLKKTLNSGTKFMGFYLVFGHIVVVRNIVGICFHGYIWK